MDDLRKATNAMYAINWELRQGQIQPTEVVGDPHVLDDMHWQLHHFQPNEGYVGKAFVDMQPVFLPDASKANDFIRAEFCSGLLDIHSMVWIPNGKGGLTEFGFDHVLNQLPDVITKTLPPSPSKNRRSSFQGVRCLAFEPALLWKTSAVLAFRFEEHGEYVEAVGAWGNEEFLKTLDWEQHRVKSTDTASCSVQACLQGKLTWIPDIEDNDHYRRKEAMLKHGIRSVVFMPQDDVNGASALELCFDKRLECIPAACRVGVYDDATFRAEVLAKLNRDRQMQQKLKKILEDVGKIHEKNGYFADADGLNMQDVDRQTGDKWIPRNPWMNRLTGIHPFNCEAPVSLLKKHGLITPNTVHYVRNHGTVPRLKWETHRITFDGKFAFPDERADSKSISMNELVSIFKPLTFACTLNCAGNRRKEQNMIQKGIGFDWGMCAASTAVWTGVLLHEVLEYMGIFSKEKGGNFVNFFGPPDELPKGDGTYGASHSRDRCMDPTRNFMLCFMMNGELLHPDHGYPVRLLCPGYIGGRMIKWLSKITVTELEGDNWYHINDNRVFPKHITSRDMATEEKIWEDPSYCIHDRNINSGIFAPTHCQKVRFCTDSSEGDRPFKVQGYAYAGAGRPVLRVEVTLNGGRNWRPAELTYPDEKADVSTQSYGQRYCWVHWAVDIPIGKLASCGEFAVRAWDDSQNSQPERPSWNLMGMMNNPWYRIKVHQIKDGMWFEHPTRVETTLDHCWDLKNNPGVEIHCDENGALVSPGWMMRMRKDVIKVYKPIEQTKEELDENEGWEVDMQRWIKK